MNRSAEPLRTLPGTNRANPAAAILSAALLARFSLGEAVAAEAIETAVEAVLADGPRTADLTAPGEIAVTTREFTDAVIAALYPQPQQVRSAPAAAMDRQS